MQSYLFKDKVSGGRRKFNYGLAIIKGPNTLMIAESLFKEIFRINPRGSYCPSCGEDFMMMELDGPTEILYKNLYNHSDYNIIVSPIQLSHDYKFLVNTSQGQFYCHEIKVQPLVRR